MYALIHFNVASLESLRAWAFFLRKMTGSSRKHVFENAALRTTADSSPEKLGAMKDPSSSAATFHVDARLFDACAFEAGGKARTFRGPGGDIVPALVFCWRFPA